MAFSTSLSNKKVVIVGAGPSGIFLANLLLQQDESVQIQIVEKSPRHGTPDSNAFGFGVGARHRRSLEKVSPLLWQRIENVSAPATDLPIRIVGRNVLCQEILQQLKEEHGTSRCRVLFDTGCSKINLDGQSVTTTDGQQLPYDLLIGADGVNSIVRQTLVNETADMQEERYIRPNLWKSLKLPPQPDLLDAGAFKPLSHPSIRGAVFPRYPQGHTALVFWKDMDLNNPKGISNEKDLTTAITTAVLPKSNKWDIARRLFFFRKTTTDETKQIRFDDTEVSRFLKSSPRREHYLKVDRYHDQNVALLGDSAHGMYSFLGQGAACGFQSAVHLSTCLENESEISNALQVYSSKAVPEGHAATDLNLIVHSVFGRLLAKLLAVPLILAGALRGRLLMKRLHEDVSYLQLVKENNLLVKVSRFFWKKERIPFTAEKKNGVAAMSE